MNLSTIIPLLKLFTESKAVSPSKPFERPARNGLITPRSGEQGVRPDCGLGKKAILENGQWVCVPLFK